MSHLVRFFIVWPVCLVLMLAGGGIVAHAQGDAPAPRFETNPCPTDLPSDKTYRCGYLIVPENHTHPNGRTIAVHVIIINSRSTTPAPDPIIYINGGPGGTTRDALETWPAYEAWLAKREVILFDQRGIGNSKPVLNCPATTDLWLQDALGVPLSTDAWLAPRRACRDKWLAEGIDLTAYNSLETAADLADLWTVLGYEQVNIYGISYGTVIAQLVAREYGATGQIRSLIWDAPVPLGVHTLAETPANLAATRQHVFIACEADWLCRQAYPDLETVYQQVLARVQAEPDLVTAHDPTTGEPFSFTFDVSDFGFEMQYGTYRTFPALIYDIYDRDYSRIIEGRAQFIKALRRRGAGQSFGLKTTIHCNEPSNIITPADWETMSIYPEAVFMKNPFDEALCAEWPHFPLMDKTPVQGDIPTLILVGGYDTRLRGYEEKLTAPLNQVTYLVVPGAGHEVIQGGGNCPQFIALAFLENPTRTPPHNCIADLGGPRFDTAFVIRGVAIQKPMQGLIGLLGLGLGGLALAGGMSLRRYQREGITLNLIGWPTMRLIGWHNLLLNILLLILALYAAGQHWLPLNQVETLAVVWPLLVAVQAAFILSPADEPALEIMLAMPRPLAWTVLERWLVLVMLHGGVGLLVSAGLVITQGVGLGVIVNRWLPVLLLLTGLIIYITLATRRAIFGILVVVLWWLMLTLFGDFMVQRWPFTWPLHLYLDSDSALYILNRLFLGVSGLVLIALAAGRLATNTEQLLLGRPRRRRARLQQVQSNGEEGEGGLIGLSSTYLATSPHQLQWLQLLALVRYEFRLHWRRVTLPIVVVSLGLTPILGAIISIPDFQGYGDALAAGTLSPELARTTITATMLPITWLGVVLIAILLLPIIVADTVPRDKQWGVFELLQTLPVTRGVYLAGKLVSLWLSLGVGVLLVGSLSALAWWIFIGSFNYWLYGHLWLVGGLGFMLINASLSCLLAAGQPSNRRAMLVGGGYVLLSLLGLGFSATLISNPSWWQAFNPARPALLLYYLLGFPGAVQANNMLTDNAIQQIQAVANFSTIYQALLAGAVEVALVWLVVYQRMGETTNGGNNE